MNTEKNNWSKFYEDRINSTYQDYFNQRYAQFIQTVDILSPKGEFIELGCGIGSVSKALPNKYGHGFDSSPEMVRLANKNLNDVRFWVADIFKESYFEDTLKVSHGVLEHFTDEQIVSITQRCQNSIHYVPLDKYVTPSFGDERLLPYEFWLELVKPNAYFLFNDNHDLAFIL